MKFNDRFGRFTSIIPLMGALLTLPACKPKAEPGHADYKDMETNRATAEEAVRIPRDQVKFASRPSPGSNGNDQHFDLILKLGEKEVKIAGGANPWDEVEPGSSLAVPVDALSGARLAYAGGSAWYYVTEEGGRFVVKVSFDDEGSPGGGDAVIAEPARAEVEAVFSKTGETIQAPSGSGD